ncbi:MAG: tetratricopeptide repeat protein [Candidatus Omnitrophota bacterium]
MKKHLILIIFVILAAYAGSLSSGFVYDDFAIIVHNNFIKSWRNIYMLFSQRYISHPMEVIFNMDTYNIGAGESTYRPVATLSYFLNYRLFKLNPWGYRLTNIVLHIINAILIYFLIRLLFKKDNLALCSAVLFGIHPVNAEVLNCTAFRPNILVFLFSLTSIFLYFKYKDASGNRQKPFFLLLSLFSFLLALFSKEIAFILPVALILCDLFYIKFDFKKIFTNFRIYILYFLVDAFYLVVYFFIFTPTLKITQSFELYNGVLSMFDVLGRYLQYMALPVSLIPRELGAPLLLISYWRIVFAIGVATLCVYLVVRRWRHMPEISFSILWFFIWLLPINNFLYSLRIPIAFRFLYIPILGFSIALAVLLIKIWDRNSRFLPALLLLRRALVILVFGYFLLFTISGNIIWKNELVFYSFAIEKYPLSTNAHSALGATFAKYGERHEAQKEFNTVLSLSQNRNLFMPFPYALASAYLGGFYLADGEYSRAEQMYLQALEVFPHSARIYTELGNCYQKQGLYKKSLEYFKEAKKINPRFTPAYINSGITYELMHKYLAAKQEWELALEIYPGATEARVLLSGLTDIINQGD